MLRTYLYPALANEILQQEDLLENAYTRITQEAGKLIDGRFPSAFSEAAAGDARQISSVEAALEKCGRAWRMNDGGSDSIRYAGTAHAVGL